MSRGRVVLFLCPLRKRAGCGVFNREKRKGGNGMISIEDFNKVDVRVGAVFNVKENKKLRNPSYGIF